MNTVTQPFCSPECRDNGGWRLDQDGRPTGRCPCRYRGATGAEARDHAITATTEAHPDATRAALLIISDAARAFPTVSANTIRQRVKFAQIPGPVMGGAFKQAVTDRVLAATGDYEPSTDPGTHGKPVAVYRSLVYRLMPGCGDT